MADEKIDDRPNYYPFDYEILVKGQYIPPDECERLSNVKRSERMYSLALQELIDGIHNRRNAMGRPVVAKAQNDGIKILTDEEAVVYVRQRFRAGLRLAGRSHERAVVAIDVSSLPEAVKRMHERNLDIQSKQLTAIAVERAKLSLPPHRRQTPRLDKRS